MVAYASRPIAGVILSDARDGRAGRVLGRLLRHRRLGSGTARPLRPEPDPGRRVARDGKHRRHDLGASMGIARRPHRRASGDCDRPRGCRGRARRIGLGRSSRLLVVLLILGGLFGASVNAASGRAIMHWFGRSSSAAWHWDCGQTAAVIGRRRDGSSRRAAALAEDVSRRPLVGARGTRVSGVPVTAESRRAASRCCESVRPVPDVATQRSTALRYVDRSSPAGALWLAADLPCRFPRGVPARAS